MSKARLDHLAQPVRPVHKAQAETVGRQVRRDQSDHQVTLEQPDHKDQSDRRDNPAQPDHKVRSDLVASRVQSDLAGHKVTLARRDQKAKKEMWALRVRPDHKDQLALRVQSDRRATPVSQDRKAIKETPVNLGFLVGSVPMARSLTQRR